MNINDFSDWIHRINGQTIAVVYIFEGENIEGFKHYDIWKSDVISEWLMAIQQNNCIPLIMDVRTFIYKAMNATLPHIDYVLNLNAGNVKLSTLGLIPSVCSFLNIPCIPCNTVSIISGEHKHLSNIIAGHIGLNIPENMKDDTYAIFRPLNLGSSKGTKKGKNIAVENKGIYQEFIKGYDITTPILYNPISEDIEILPTVMYYPENRDIEWFFNEDVKETRGGYKKEILQLDSKTRDYFIKLAKSIDVSCYCRIDSRIKCNSSSEWEDLLKKPIEFERIFFIEINPMPTLKHNINFYNSINSLTVEDPFYDIYKIYNLNRNTPTPTGFILLCSMLSYFKAKY